MSSVLAIDFGNENLVISAPRKGGIDIINNSAQRLIPSMVAFSEIRRYSGSHAQQQQTMNIKSTITNLKKLIGLKYDTNEREDIQKQLPFKLIKLDDGYVGVEVKYLNENHIFRIEQCISLLFSNAFKIAKSQDINANDCVIVVPPFWDEIKRRSILLAAKISGFNVLKLLNSTTAASISYSMYQRKKLPKTDEKPVPVAFIDFGESSLSVSLAMLKQGSVEVKGFAYDDRLGGRDFTSALVDMLLEKTRQKYGIDPTSNQRQMLRFIQTAEKVKKNLSINRAITFDIQNFMNGVDVNFVVKREEYEERISALIEKVGETILRALKSSSIEKEDVFAIEVHGGASRVKAVKDKIREVFGKEFTQSLNPDEIFSIGAGFQAAILSSQYKVDLKVSDVSTNQIVAEIEDENGSKDKIELFKQFEALPSTKTIPVKMSKKCQIHFFNEHSNDLGKVEIEADKEEPVTVNLTVSLTSDGIINIDEVKSTETDNTVHFTFKSCYEFSDDEIEKFKEEEMKMSKRDQDEADIDRARDSLRDYIFTMYTYIMCDFPGFDPSKKIEYLQKIMQVQGWFEDNEFSRLSLQDYKNQIEILKEFGEPAIARKKSRDEFPNKIQELIENADFEKKKLDNKDEKFSHITEDERNVVRNEIDDYIKWINEKNEEVEKLPQFVEIPFKISEAQMKLEEIEKKVINIFMKPKPVDAQKNEEAQPVDTANQNQENN